MEKKSPTLFWNYLNSNVKTKWDIFSNFYGLLRISELKIVVIQFSEFKNWVKLSYSWQIRTFFGTIGFVELENFERSIQLWLVQKFLQSTSIHKHQFFWIHLIPLVSLRFFIHSPAGNPVYYFFDDWIWHESLHNF